MNPYQEDLELMLGFAAGAEKEEMDQLQKDLDQLFVDRETTAVEVEDVLPEDLAKLVGSFVADADDFVSYPRLDGKTLRRLRVRTSKELVICGEETLDYQPKYSLPENQNECLHQVNRATEFCPDHAWTPEIRSDVAFGKWTVDLDSSFVSRGPVTQSPDCPDALRVQDKSGDLFCDFNVVHSGERVESARDFHFNRSDSSRLYSVLVDKRVIV